MVYWEQEQHQKKIDAIFSKQIYYLACHELNRNDVAADLRRMLKGRFLQRSRPPQILFLGPPGSGRTSQAEKISQRFGLTLVSPEKLIWEQMVKNPGLRVHIRKLLQ